MPKPFYSLKIRYFGNIAWLILCATCFFLPFAGRGARLSLDNMQNNVADWLPGDYPETKDLKEFRKYFYGDQFVVVSGPWCHEGDPKYEKLLQKLAEESLEYETTLIDSGRTEELRAHRVGDKLGLMYHGSYHEDWGENREKWLMGEGGQWYFINSNGELFRWDGQNNVVEGAKRQIEKTRNGGVNKANGLLVDQFGLPPSMNHGEPNPFYVEPKRLFARPFKSIVTGPAVFDQMAGPEGTLRIQKSDSEEDLSVFEAKIEAHNRLTGALFGNTPSPTFSWTFDSLLRHVDDPASSKMLQLDPVHRQNFDKFIEKVVDEQFGGTLTSLTEASQKVKLRLWYEMWYQLNIEPPPRQTCIIVTLNEPVIGELARVVGRPLMGKPRGRILELATRESGIAAENVRIGGPPSDNVAIDEEGTRTLVNLVGVSAFLGITIAWFSFQSWRLTLMLFFVGGTAAMASLSYVWFAGDTMDAILMSMPSLIYVLGLSGAVHIVNYYKEECLEYGSGLAAERAVSHALFPCALAAFTTALGLVSLCTSNLVPISKFGFYSAIATLATIVLLFTWLPSALTVWKPGYEKLPPGERDAEGGMAAKVGRFWDAIGNWVVGHYSIVLVAAALLMGVGMYGISKIETQVHLLKLFDKNAKILDDYRWMEANLGTLVPAEIVINIDNDAQREPYREDRAAIARRQRDNEIEFTIDPEEKQQLAESDLDIEIEQQEWDLRLSMLERMELSQRVRKQLERFFGPEGTNYVGSGMSTDVFAPLHKIDSQVQSVSRDVFSDKLYEKRSEMLEQDYLAVGGQTGKDANQRSADKADPARLGREMWRISIRLAALSDVDYGRFINDLKAVIEPILTAYRYRDDILTALYEQHAGEPGDDSAADSSDWKVLVLGPRPDSDQLNIKQAVADGRNVSELIDQTFIFADTLKEILENRGITARSAGQSRFYKWIDPEQYNVNNPMLSDGQREKVRKLFENNWQSYIAGFDCVVLIQDDPLFDVELIKTNARKLIDARDHVFHVNPKTKQPMPGELTALERQKNDEPVDITAIYTGIVPIVYKAQRSLLTSLIESILLAFIMISVVMMILLRDWRRRPAMDNLLNFRGGMAAMIPNIFPIVVVFGIMGWRHIKVDIGSMMTASVAMGIAVDDTIHFLNWYRSALGKGKTRIEAIRVAYGRVATAMTQTTLIGGLGLSAFALSTFTPTQRFGTLMLFLLAAALIGDLIVLPAVLASPLGKLFGGGKNSENDQDETATTLRIVGDDMTATGEVAQPGNVTQQNLKNLQADANANGSSLPDIHPDSFGHLGKSGSDN